MGKAQVNNKYSNPLPAGIIVEWYGAANAVPFGRAICDGQNGTPDLRDKFVVGAGKTYTLNAQGGEAAHTLTVPEMPSHAHSLLSMAKIQSGTKRYQIERFIECDGWTDSIGWPDTRTTGNSQPHNNLPPYFALFKIMKL